jgi:hypothetical protein
MKKLCLLLLVFIFYLDSNGQWYKRQYGVSDIRHLSTDQLTISFGEAKEITASGLKVICAGGIVFLIGILEPANENPNLLEKLLELRAFEKLFKVTGIGLICGGAITGFIGLNRTNNIKHVLYEADIHYGRMTVEPTFLVNNSTNIIYPGLRLMISF